jgi:NACalpha-BTF3-like transcription factor
MFHSRISGDILANRYSQKGIVGLPIHELHHFYTEKKARTVAPDNYFDSDDIKIVMTQTGVCFDTATFLLQIEHGNPIDAIETYQHALDFGDHFFDPQ